MKLLLLAVLSCQSIGCRQQERLNVLYGQRRGAAATSVNGTSVLAHMFENEGFQAITWYYLSPRLSSCNVIVWAPDDFAPPSDDVRDYLEKWLVAGDARTLVYIGRDYDAAVEYWGSITPETPPEQAIEVRRRWAEARAAHDAARLNMPREACAEWFTARRDYPPRRIQQLSGPWSDGVDASRTCIRLQGQLDVPTKKELQSLGSGSSAVEASRYDTLLSGDSVPLAFRLTKNPWGGSQILVVSNGSFLLNLPLVNHEHRQLAAALIRQCGKPGRVAFLESGPQGPMILPGDPKPAPSDALRKRLLLAFHWLILGILFCFSAYPIFGRPKAPDTECVADFDQHIEALGGLLERTGDRAYVQRRLRQYRDGARQDTPGRAVVTGATTLTQKDGSPVEVGAARPSGT